MPSSGQSPPPEALRLLTASMTVFASLVTVTGPTSNIWKKKKKEKLHDKLAYTTKETKLWLTSSAKQRRTPCSGPPNVYQDLRARHDWSVENTIVNLPIRLKGNSKRIFCNSWSPLGDLTKLPWRRQRQTSKSRGFSKQNNSSARVSRFFVHFFDQILSFSWGQNGKALNSTISVWTQERPLLFSSNINSNLLSNWATWDNREMGWNNAESIFQQGFHGRRRCRIVRSLLLLLRGRYQPRFDYVCRPGLFWWSFFTLIYNRSSKMNYFIYFTSFDKQVKYLLHCVNLLACSVISAISSKRVGIEWSTCSLTANWKSHVCLLTLYERRVTCLTRDG